MPGSVPFGGRYRAIDFMLSNMHNAGITDVGVVLHGNYQSLIDHIGNGKTWDMARRNGGLKLLPPFADERKYRGAVFRGKIDALSGVRSYLREIRQKYVVLSERCTLEEGASVQYSLLMPGAVIRRGAQVSYAIIGENAVVEANARVGQPPEAVKPEDWGITVLGPDAAVAENYVLAAKRMRGADGKETVR